VAERGTVEKRVVESTRHYSERIKKRYWILSYLYYHQTDSPSNLHAISRAVEERMELTVRDQDIRDLIEELVLRRMVVRNMSSADSTTEYRISYFGIKWWEEHGEALKQIL
jgi:hypothetical protein